MVCVHFIAQNATFGYEDKQRVLETLPPVHRLELCIRMMAKELDILRLESEINDQVQQNVNQNQRDYYLRFLPPVSYLRYDHFSNPVRDLLIEPV